MNGRDTIIEQQLAQIDSATFQRLCDRYLAIKYPMISFNLIGTMIGKNKTIKGTPDTSYRDESNNLYFVEYTTHTKSLKKKIISDIDSCLDTNKSGVKPQDIHQVIFFFNSRLTAKDENDINHYAQDKKIQIQLTGIDLLLSIVKHYPSLSKEYLGITLDTGQLLLPEEFIYEYNNKASKLSSPLDNQFLFREQELETIAMSFEEEELIILSGIPGIGKTKLALESIKLYQNANQGFGIPIHRQIAEASLANR